MAIFTKNELKLFEELFIHKNGSIANMNRKKFEKFIYDSIDVDITSESYEKKVRNNKKYYSRKQIYRFIVECETKDNSIKFLNDLIDYVETGNFEYDENKLIKAKDILKTKANLKYDLSQYEGAEKRVQDLVDNINQTIDNGRPQFAIGELHTYLHNYTRFLCDKHEIEYTESEKLDKLFKEYIKAIDSLIENKFSKSILRQSVSIFSELNKIRNNNSSVHDNELLNEAESLLVFRYIESLFEYIKTIERYIDKS